MARNRTPSRRRVVSGAAGVALASVAGCADPDAGDEADDTDGEVEDTDGEVEDTDGEADDTGGEADDTGGEADDTGGEADDGSGGSDGTDADLDLREANVVDVAFEATGEGYAFDVTLHHDDDGEDGYANWWQVERLDGTRLGRRELVHAHSDQPFTRSETVEVPDDASCVVVRGHDQTHEYGGTAAVVDLDTGSARLVDQGPDARSFDATDCP